MSKLPQKKPKLEQNLEVFVKVDPVEIVETRYDSNSKAKAQEDFNSALDENTKVVLGELLRNILNGMSSTDLLENSRLVSRRWRDDATWILRRRLNSFGASFKFHPGKNSFISFKSKDANPKEENDEENQDKKQVSKLTELFKSFPAHNFPSTHFHFEGGSLDCPQILELFSAYGENIKKLTVDVWKNPLTRDGALRQKIFKLAPKLESLELTDPNEDASRAEARSEGFLAAENIPEVNPGQGQGQLKTLKFSGSIRHFHVIQKLLSQIQSELLNNCGVSIANLAFNTNSDLNLNPEIFNGHLRNQVYINDVLLQLFVFDSIAVRRLEQFADCRLKFKELSLISCWNTPISQNDIPRIGKSLGKILDFTRETLTTAEFSAESFLLLTRQPFSPNFFPVLKYLTVNFILIRAQQKANCDLTAAMFLPRSNSNSISNPDPNSVPLPLWKNLSEVMPSLESLTLDLFDGDCEPWLPFFEADAQENSTVKRLHVYNLYRLEILGKLNTLFPSIQTMMIIVSLTPPPSAFDSWPNLIQWLFSTSQGNENKSTSGKIKNAQQGLKMNKRKWNNMKTKHEPIPQPIANFKFLECLHLQFKSCGGSLNSTQGKTTATNTRASTSTSQPKNAENSTVCLLSKISQVKWYSREVENHKVGFDNSKPPPPPSSDLQINKFSSCLEHVCG